MTSCHRCFCAYFFFDEIGSWAGWRWAQQLPVEVEMTSPEFEQNELLIDAATSAASDR
jgi:hypothetical protein